MNNLFEEEEKGDGKNLP